MRRVPTGATGVRRRVPTGATGADGAPGPGRATGTVSRGATSCQRDQRVRRPVVRAGVHVAGQVLVDPPRQLLAQLDAPLVERVDVPDRALHEHLVLVERDELAERPRIEPAIDDRRRRPVAGEHLVRQQLLERAPREALRLEFARGLRPRSCRTSAPRSARSSWRAAVGGARRAGCATARRPGSRTGSAACPGESADRTRAGRWCRARPRRPGRCRSRRGAPVAIDALAVALHVELLQVGGQPLQVLVVRAAPRSVCAPRKLRYQTPSRPSVTGGSARSAPCGSARPSRARRRATPRSGRSRWRWRSGRPIDDQSE